MKGCEYILTHMLSKVKTSYREIIKIDQEQQEPEVKPGKQEEQTETTSGMSKSPSKAANKKVCCSFATYFVWIGHFSKSFLL